MLRPPMTLAAATDVPEAATLLRVLGNELREARKRHGWIRRDLQARLPSDVSLQTLATYEQGTRGLGVMRLVEICAVLETSAPELLDRAIRQVTIPKRTPELRIDLRRLAGDEGAGLAPLHRWARTQLASRPGRATTMNVPGPALEHLAELCGLTPAELITSLRALRASA